MVTQDIRRTGHEMDLPVRADPMGKGPGSFQYQPSRAVLGKLS